MANIVRIKRRASGASGAPTSLANAELAFNEVDDILYYGKGSGGANGSASTIEAIGGKGAYVDKSTDQTIGGNKTFNNAIVGSVTGNAGSATQLATGRTISISGDLSYTSGSFDGTGNVTGTGTLANSGITAGTYTKITVDAKGRATVGANPTTLSGYGITDAQPLDADLTSIAGLSGASGLLKKVSSNTWSLDTNTYITGISSSDVTTALGYTPESTSNKGQANGYASLDGDGKVPSSQLPSYVDDVLEYGSTSSFPGTGTAGIIYVARDTNKTYRWSGSTYIEISSSPGSTDSVAEGSTNLYFTQERARQSISASGSLSYNSSTGAISFTDAVTSVAGKTGAVTVTKSDVDLGSVENTALSTWTGSTYITTLGTISSGAWNGSTISVSYGGTGATTLTGIVKGNGTSAFTAAVAGTDYLSPSSDIDGGTF